MLFCSLQAGTKLRARAWRSEENAEKSRSRAFLLSAFSVFYCIRRIKVKAFCFSFIYNKELGCL